ncbi:hypothetical protein GDO81_009053 [Engystomops pustulosus]|uniref:Uncharacterized protein n=1 Tax=Engystomops pustulosus TaxID=76066 RepID=A0AAV7BN54_ENGPU|nr:hypothetical protein GDO81_009053 [Engystomops pustulosus]
MYHPHERHVDGLYEEFPTKIIHSPTVSVCLITGLIFQNLSEAPLPVFELWITNVHIYGRLHIQKDTQAYRINKTLNWPHM